jgi:hypothetical protein
LPRDAPLVFAPAALALLAAIADDGVPVAVGLLLIVGGDLERGGFTMFDLTHLLTITKSFFERSAARQ